MIYKFQSSLSSAQASIWCQQAAAVCLALYDMIFPADMVFLLDVIPKQTPSTESNIGIHEHSYRI